MNRCKQCQKGDHTALGGGGEGGVCDVPHCFTLFLHCHPKLINVRTCCKQKKIIHLVILHDIVIYRVHIENAKCGQ